MGRKGAGGVVGDVAVLAHIAAMRATDGLQPRHFGVEWVLPRGVTACQVSQLVPVYLFCGYSVVQNPLRDRANHGNGHFTQDCRSES